MIRSQMPDWYNRLRDRRVYLSLCRARQQIETDYVLADDPRFVSWMPEVPPPASEAITSSDEMYGRAHPETWSEDE